MAIFQAVCVSPFALSLTLYLDAGELRDSIQLHPQLLQIPYEHIWLAQNLCVKYVFALSSLLCSSSSADSKKALAGLIWSYIGFLVAGFLYAIMGKTSFIFSGIPCLVIASGILWAICQQASFIPQSLGPCGQANSSSLAEGMPNLFQVLANLSTPENHSNKCPEEYCEDFVIQWRLQVAAT
jgi:hypothetical protein